MDPSSFFFQRWKVGTPIGADTVDFFSAERPSNEMDALGAGAREVFACILLGVGFDFSVGPPRPNSEMVARGLGAGAGAPFFGTGFDATGPLKPSNERDGLGLEAGAGLGAVDGPPRPRNERDGLGL